MSIFSLGFPDQNSFQLASPSLAYCFPLFNGNVFFFLHTSRYKSLPSVNSGTTGTGMPSLTLLSVPRASRHHLGWFSYFQPTQSAPTALPALLRSRPYTSSRSRFALSTHCLALRFIPDRWRRPPNQPSTTALSCVRTLRCNLHVLHILVAYMYAQVAWSLTNAAFSRLQSATWAKSYLLVLHHIFRFRCSRE